MLSAIKENCADEFSKLSDDCICVTASGTPIKPKTIGQKNYVEAIKENIITLGVGPAGTGKRAAAAARRPSLRFEGDDAGRYSE